MSAEATQSSRGTVGPSQSPAGDLGARIHAITAGRVAAKSWFHLFVPAFRRQLKTVRIANANRPPARTMHKSSICDDAPSSHSRFAKMTIEYEGYK